MDSFLSDLLQNLLTAFLPLLAVAVVSWATRTFVHAWTEFRSTRPDIAALLEQAASLAVKAAEQAGAGGVIDDKKGYALAVAEKWLAANKINIDLDLVDAAVEAAVYEYFNREIVQVEDDGDDFTGLLRGEPVTPDVHGTTGFRGLLGGER